MRLRWLGWAGVEIEADGARVVVDPLADPGAVFAWMGDRAAAVPVPEITAPREGSAAGLLTHLHRDHADAGALTAALASDAAVYEPVPFGGEALEQSAVLQADTELTASGLSRSQVAAWSTVEVGPFQLTALPAVDGTGDPQISWLIAAGDSRVLHLGDTMWHGWWWRFRARFGALTAVCAPINGARLSFPHRRPASPLPGVMDASQAGLAAEILGAQTLLPIHYGAYDLAGVYEPDPDPLGTLATCAVPVTALAVGESIEL